MRGRQSVQPQLPPGFITVVLQVNKKQQLEDFLKQCAPGSGSSKWGVCALLLSNRGDTSALYKSLALR